MSPAVTTTFSRLKAVHAPEIAAMEDVYPLSMRQGEAVLRERLGHLESTRFQMSWVARREGRCLSYLIAHPSTSQLDVPEPDHVIYIDDLQVREGHPGHLFQLLKLLAKDLHALGLAGLPIEGVCRRSSYRVFRDHQELIARLGWELAAQKMYWDDAAGESMCWLRWMPRAGSEAKAS